MNCVFVIAKPSMANMIRTTTKILRICVHALLVHPPCAAGILEFHGDCVTPAAAAPRDQQRDGYPRGHH